MDLFLTGASGLVGSRLLPRLVGAGHECRALIRGDIELPAGVNGIRGDLHDASSLAAAVKGAHAVVHLAALFRTPDEAAIWQANREGTRNLIEATRTHAPQARFVMASTSNVYDDGQSRPGREDDACSPTGAYPASKMAAEQLLRVSGLTWSVLRLPFVYGDGDGHLTSLSELAERFGLHPAHTYSVAHHRDVATIVQMALDGTFDDRTVNLTDDADATVQLMTELGGNAVEASASSLQHPWAGRMDGTLARSLGFSPLVPTIRAAAEQGLL